MPQHDTNSSESVNLLNPPFFYVIIHLTDTFLQCTAVAGCLLGLPAMHVTVNPFTHRKKRKKKKGVSDHHCFSNPDASGLHWLTDPQRIFLFPLDTIRHFNSIGWFEIYSTEVRKAHTFKAEVQTNMFYALFVMSMPILGVWELDGIIEMESLCSLQLVSSAKCFELGFC